MINRRIGALAAVCLALLIQAHSLAASSQKRLLYFYDSGSKLCKEMDAILSQIDFHGVELERIEFSKNPARRTERKIEGVPCLVYMKADVEVARRLGVTSKHRVLAMIGPRVFAAPRANVNPRLPISASRKPTPPTRKAIGVSSVELSLPKQHQQLGSLPCATIVPLPYSLLLPRLILIIAVARNSCSARVA